MIGRMISHFEITAELGRGGMGIVYKAVDTQLHVDRALKFLSPDSLGDDQSRARLIDEARSLASVQHPNICPVHEIGEVGDQVFIAMSFLEGQTLEDKLADGPLPVESAIAITKQITAGLEKAHAQGVIHRDIKPANVMITNDGSAVIMDFGLAKRADVASKTRTGTLMGTAAYISPEQVQGHAVDHRTDMWSLGVMVYEMLTGRRPFLGDYESALIYSITSENPDPLAPQCTGIAPALEEIVERLLEKDSKHRYADASALLAALNDLDPAGGSTTTRTIHIQRWHRRRLNWALAGVIPFVALLLVALFVWPGFLDPDPAISRLAVLPFVDSDADEEQAYFADGVANELVSKLTKVRTLARVISMGSARKAATQHETVSDIGTALDVDALVQGSLTQFGDRVRINVQLVRVTDENLIWAESYERNREDILSMEGEIVRDVMRQIKIELSPQDEKVLTTSRVVDKAAHDAYLRGNYYLIDITPENMEKSLQYFKQSLEIDPTFAPAWVGLAGYYKLMQLAQPRGEIYPKAKAAIERALMLDDTIALAHSEAGILRFYFEWDWDGPEEYFRRAIALDPMNTGVLFWYTAYLGNIGRNDEAIVIAKRLVELDPLSGQYQTNLGWAYWAAGRHEESIVELEKAREFDPDSFWNPMELAWNYSDMGRYDDAFREYDNALALKHENFVSILLGTLGRTYALAQRDEEALAVLDQLTEMAKDKYIDPVWVAMIPAGLGDADGVFHWLQKGLEVQSASMISIKLARTFSEYQTNPRFYEILRQMTVPIN